MLLLLLIGGGHHRGCDTAHRPLKSQRAINQPSLSDRRFLIPKIPSTPHSKSHRYERRIKKNLRCLSLVKSYLLRGEGGVGGGGHRLRLLTGHLLHHGGDVQGQLGAAEAVRPVAAHPLAPGTSGGRRWRRRHVRRAIRRSEKKSSVH